MKMFLFLIETFILFYSFNQFIMISKELIKRAIIEREQEFIEKFKKERYIDRELKIDNINYDVATVITGIRRAGKSVLAFSLTQNEKSVYVNFEDERLILDVNELNDLVEAIYELKGNVETFVFDEIQYVKGWERFISRLLPHKKIIITGSNSRLMSKEFGTVLTGRHIDYELFPFSFREYLKYRDFVPNPYLTENIAKLKNLLIEYIELGGLPLAYTFGNRFLEANYSDIILRDIVQRYKLRFEKSLRKIALYYLSNVSNLVSFNNIAKNYNLSVDTVIEYSHYFTNSYLFFFLNKFDFKLKQQNKSSKKVYCIDTGFINALSFKFSNNFGRPMENVVAIELLRQKSYRHNNWEIYYWKDYQQHEVDFVIKEGLKVKQLIQVSYVSSKEEINKREIRALLKASKELQCKDLLIITWDYEAEEDYGGKIIKFIPLWKWLLEE